MLADQSARRNLFRVGLAAGALLPFVVAGPMESHAMSGYKWKNRPLVVFAPNNQSAAFRRQVAIINARRSGFRERDMVVIAVVGNRVQALIGRGPGMSAVALRRRYGVAAGSFRAILVGKDGGVKLSTGSPLSTGRLFGTIDAMPMRRQEMRRRGS
ncbi:MAG: DUF4174 domain-containing protein [Pseudomonadota bacterium]